MAQWTTINNSARRAATDSEERRGGKVELGDERQAENMREPQDGRVGVCKAVSSRGGET